MEPFEADDVLLPLPDEGAADGLRYLSQPVALRDVGDRMAIQRVRQVIDGSGRERSSDDVIHLDKVAPAHVEIDGLAAGPAGARGARDPADGGPRRHDRGDAPWLSCASARCIRTS